MRSERAASAAPRDRRVGAGETEASQVSPYVVSPYVVSPYLQQPLRSYEQAFRELQAKRLRHDAQKRQAGFRGEAETRVRRRTRRAETGRN